MEEHGIPLGISMLNHAFVELLMLSIYGAMMINVFLLQKSVQSFKMFKILFFMEEIKFTNSFYKLKCNKIEYNMFIIIVVF